MIPKSGDSKIFIKTVKSNDNDYATMNFVIAGCLVSIMLIVAVLWSRHLQDEIR